MLRNDSLREIHLPGCLIVALLLPATAGAQEHRKSETQQHSTSAVSLIQISKGNLGWAGIWIGATRRDVQHALGRELEPKYDENTMACGEFRSAITISGCPAEIQWSTKELDGKVESISVPLTPEDLRIGGKALVSQLMKRCPGLTLDDTDLDDEPDTQEFELWPARKHDPVILLKTGRENILFVSEEECLD